MNVVMIETREDCFAGGFPFWFDALLCSALLYSGGCREVVQIDAVEEQSERGKKEEGAGGEGRKEGSCSGVEWKKEEKRGR